jgi:hypothetical protein
MDNWFQCWNISGVPEVLRAVNVIASPVRETHCVVIFIVEIPFNLFGQPDWLRFSDLTWTRQDLSYTGNIFYGYKNTNWTDLVKIKSKQQNWSWEYCQNNRIVTCWQGNDKLFCQQGQFAEPGFHIDSPYGYNLLLLIVECSHNEFMPLLLVKLHTKQHMFQN